MAFIQFTPIYQERVWGGRDLANRLGRKLPPEGVFGESWEIVDRPEAQSVVQDGEFAGLTLRALIEQHSARVMGSAWESARPFPILVKWLDCQERLSLQVHPPASIAPELGGEPKTECWYIAECREGAGLLAGLCEGVTRADFAQALEQGMLEPLCHRFEISRGDHIFIPSGRIHAIDAGNLILEIQQNSDTTYRVYDWGRVGLDGKPRQLHLEESLASIDFDDFEPQPTRATLGEQTVADCAEFRTRKLEIAGGARLILGAQEEPRLLGLITGEIQDEDTQQTLKRGDNALIPWETGSRLIASEDVTLLVTDHFTQV